MADPVEIIIQNFTSNNIEILVLDSVSNKIVNKYISKPRKYNSMKESINDVGSRIFLPKNILRHITLIFRMNEFDETYNFENTEHTRIIITLYLDDTANYDTDKECEILLSETVSVGLKKNNYIKQSHIKSNSEIYLLLCLICISIAIIILIFSLAAYLIEYIVNK